MLKKCFNIGIWIKKNVIKFVYDNINILNYFFDILINLNLCV